MPSDVTVLARDDVLQYEGRYVLDFLYGRLRLWVLLWSGLLPWLMAGPSDVRIGMADHKISIGEGVAIVDAWLDHHFPGDPRGYVPQHGYKPHLWKVLPGPHGPGFQIAVEPGLLQRSGMLADRLDVVERGTSAQKPGAWILISTRGVERPK